MSQREGMESVGGPKMAKERLFGSDGDDHLRKQMIKARFMRGLQQPTGGIDTSDAREGSTEPSVDDLSAEPVRIDRFSILRKLGQGGMGVVYAAYDEQLDRKVALKLLRGELSKDERGRARMLREAQALARLSHPNIVQVHEIGQWQDHDYLAMEFLDGQTLLGWVDERERNWREILDVMIQAGRGLAAAHAAGLVHRDFKPANLLVDRSDRLRVLDFGLARASDESDTYQVPDALETDEHGVIIGDAAGSGEASRGDLTSHSSAFDQLLTVTGAVLGTPAYMAPEQHLGQRATELSDQFSFNMVLYEALFGERPFRAKSRNEHAIRVTEGDFTVPGASSGVPAWLRQAVCRGLAPVPAERWPSMAAQLLELERDRSRKWRRVTVAAGLVASVGVALVIGSTGGHAAAQVCQIDRSVIEDSWGEAEREQLHASFMATGLSGAVQVLEQTEAGLDAYADQLVAARRGACEQRWVEKSQTDTQLELRVACLEQREGELRAAVEVLADADSELVWRAPEILRSLGDVSLCERVELLERNTPVPKDEITVAAIGEAREDLARAHVARRSGRLEDSQILAASLRRRARHLDYEPLLGEIAFLEGTNHAQAQGYQEARAKFIEAAGVAERNNDVELSAQVWLQLAWLAAISDVEPDSSAEFVMAQARVELLGDRPADLYLLHSARGQAFEAKGKFEASLAEFGEAVRLAEAGFSGSDHQLVAALRSRSSAAASLGRYPQAHLDLARASELRVTLGADNPNILHTEFDLAVLELEHGDHADAEQHFIEVLAGYARIFGPRYVMIGHGRLALARIALARGQASEANMFVDQALEILDEAHSDHAWALDAAAQLQMEQEAFGVAEELLGRALEHTRSLTPGATHDLGYLHGRRGVALSRAGRHEEALLEFDRAIELLDPASLLVARPLLERGRSRIELSQPMVALASLEQAVELTPADCGDPELAAAARIQLARALRELGRHERQVELATDAERLLADIQGAAPDLALAQELKNY